MFLDHKIQKIMKLKYALTILILIIVAQKSNAQKMYTSLSYNTSVPLGDTQDYISKYSWRGVGFEGNWFLNEEFTLGIRIDWNVFHEKTSGDFTDGTNTLSGTQRRNINIIPVLVEGRYHLGENNTLRPYAGIGLGTYRTLQRTEMGIFLADNNNWQFGFAPSVGVLIPVGPTSLNMSLRYNLALESGDATAHSYLGINLGVAWIK